MLQKRRLAQLRREIEEISPSEAAARQARGGLLIDIRDPEEIVQGSPSGAKRPGRSFLEMQIETLAPDPSSEILLICGTGARSLFAADALRGLGYQAVRSVEGGFFAWAKNGLPVEKVRILSASEQQRYARHLKIPEIGTSGQARLLSKKVMLVGAGGLGSPIAYYLAAAGLGTLVLVDDDRLERSNLQRQILHTDERVGQLKISSAAETLKAFNPDVKLELHEARVTPTNVRQLLAGCDLVIDGSDNLATRYAVNDASVELGIPMVYGAIFRFEGQVAAFWPDGPNRGPCYRCLFPEPPPRDLTPSCSEAGVLGVLPGVIGTIMATEALKILLGIGTPLMGRLMTYNALDGRFQDLALEADPACPLCSSKERHQHASA